MPLLNLRPGTPPIVEAVGLAAAIEYIENIGQENIAMHEDNLLKFATSELQKYLVCQFLD